MIVKFLIGDWVIEPVSGRIGRVISRCDFCTPIVRFLGGEVETLTNSDLREYVRW